MQIFTHGSGHVCASNTEGMCDAGLCSMLCRGICQLVVQSGARRAAWTLCSKADMQRPMHRYSPAGMALHLPPVSLLCEFSWPRIDCRNNQTKEDLVAVLESKCVVSDSKTLPDHRPCMQFGVVVPLCCRDQLHNLYDHDARRHVKMDVSA